MRTHGRLGYLAIALGAVAGVTGCAARTTTEAIGTPVAATSSVQPGAVQGLGVREPKVAKTQKWVKIYSGPSAEDIDPPRSTTRGSNTVELNGTPSDKIGTYVSDGAGRTLYRFDSDSAKPPKSTCNGDCAKTWPPLLIKSPGKIYPKGINPKILGYVERADGRCQVTINGWPVYYFAGDSEPGDFRGQGIKSSWFAVTPTGGKTHYQFDDPGTAGSVGAY